MNGAEPLLVLVPTDVEARLLFADDPPLSPMAVCGFGLADAGAGAAHAIARRRPRRRPEWF